MNKEILERFQNKPVKIIFTDGFILFGTIIEVHDDCVLFKTPKMTSVIAFSRIVEVAPVELKQ